MIDSAIRKRGVLEQTRNALLITDPERLINYGRVVTAGFAIIAIHLDPTQPSVFRAESRHVLAFYALLATFLLAFPIRRPVAHPAHLVVHLIDSAVLGWLVNTFASAVVGLVVGAVIVAVMHVLPIKRGVAH